MVNLHSEDERIAQFMDTVPEALAGERGLSPELTHEMITEMQTHILALYDAYLELDYSPEEAVTLTLAKFGSADRAVGRRRSNRVSRRAAAAAAMMHIVVGIVAFSVAPMTLETSGDFSLIPMIFGGFAGYFISRQSIRSENSTTIFALKVAVGSSMGYLSYGLSMVSRSAITLDECLLRTALMAATFLVLGFALRWSWLESKKFAEINQRKGTAIAQ